MADSKDIKENMLKVIYKRDLAVGEKMEHCLLKILAYFSIFDFPLSKDEIRRFLSPGSNEECMEPALSRLVDCGVIFKLDEFFSLQNDVALVKRKQDGYEMAQQLIPKAKKIGKLIARFPYVRAVGISGGLSKMYAHKKADIDFFVITRPDRLWIARTLLHIYKKVTFISGTQHYHCMNYFVDEKALRLDNQNVYIAFETITLIPVCGEAIHDFFAANNWVNEWFVQYHNLIAAKQSPAPKSLLKRLIEWLLNNRIGSSIDNYLMKLTTRRWQRKQDQKALNYEGKQMSLLTGKHFAWSNPDSFQQKIVELYAKKMQDIKDKWPEYFQSSNNSFEV